MFDYQYDKAQIIRDLGIEASDEAFKTHVLARIDQLLDDKMKNRVENELTDDEMKAFSEAESREAAQAVLREFLPDIDDIYKEEFEDIMEDLKATLNA